MIFNKSDYLQLEYCTISKIINTRTSKTWDLITAPKNLKKKRLALSFVCCYCRS